MIPQKVSASRTVPGRIYVLTNKGLMIHEGESRIVWSLPEGSKADLRPVFAVDNSDTFLVLCDSLKQVYLIKIEDGSIVRQFKSEKAPNVVIFECDDDKQLAILIADRHGDVSRHTVSLDSNHYSVEVIIGHVSIVTDMESKDGLLVTADRDEKLRISSLSSPYEIRAFLLGHSDYVAGCAIIGDNIVSVSGDGTVRLWPLNADGSEMRKNLLQTVQLDPDLFGIKVKVEKVVNESVTDEHVEEELEEFEQSVVEPNSLIVNETEVCILFDRKNKVCRMNVTDGKLDIQETVELAPSYIILSACYSDNKLMFLCFDSDKKVIGLYKESEFTPLISDVVDIAVIDGLWKRSLRKNIEAWKIEKSKKKRAHNPDEQSESE